MSDLNQPYLYLAPSFGVTPSEFRHDVSHLKTKVARLSYGVVCVILGLAIFVEL